jgi:hypothetical protein
MATTATNDPKALVAEHNDASTDSWFPLFEFQEWAYQSFLILPTPAESNADPGTVVTARKWAKGTLFCGQALRTADGYTLDGRLSFLPGVDLSVSGKGALGTGNNPAPFKATGIGTDGPTKGAIYQLVGWVFPETPILNGAARVLSVKGSVRSVRGPDTKPEIELGGMPAITAVGAFAIERASSQ